jgi:SpoVK/Ycf46/Vps4 family AAA+-type ATPase
MDGVGRSQGEGGLSGNDDDGGKGGGIIVIGATNRLNALDNAILRKGRFQNIIFVAPPNEENQIKLVDYFSSKFKLNSDQTESVKRSLKSNISGAEIENLCREQMMNLLRDRLNQTIKK